MRAWLEIDLNLVRQNYEVVAQRVGSGVEVIAVVKANAYGHGLAPIVKTLDKTNVSMYAVISLEEAQTIRGLSQKPVLILGYLNSKEINEAIEAGFILSLYDKELAALFERLASRLNKTVKAHLKVETGLNRLGVTVEEATDLLTARRHFPHLAIEAIYSHLANSTNREANLEQLRRLQDLILAIQGKVELLPIHFANSGALQNFPEGYFDAVRVGLALYGVDETVLPGLQPTLRCKSVIMQIKSVEEGEGISYDHLFVAPKKMTVGVVAIGYNEGYTQALTGKAEVLVAGQRVKVLGKITMNFIVVDLDKAPAKRGDEVVLIGNQQGPDGQSETIRVTELAKWSNLRHHEIITRLGNALPKLYDGGN